MFLLLKRKKTKIKHLVQRAIVNDFNTKQPSEQLRFSTIFASILKIS